MRIRVVTAVLVVAAATSACGGEAPSAVPAAPSPSESTLSPEEIQKMYDDAAKAAKTEDPNSPNDLTIKEAKPASSSSVSWKTSEGFTAKASLKVYEPKVVSDSSTLCPDVDGVTSPDMAALTYTVVVASEDTSPAGFSWPSTTNIKTETLSESSASEGQIVDVVGKSDGRGLGEWFTCIDGEAFSPDLELPHFAFGSKSQFTVFTLGQKTPDHPDGAWSAEDLTLRVTPADGIKYTEKDGGCKDGVDMDLDGCQVILQGSKTD